MKRTILTAALAACALSATAQIMEERNPVPMTPGGGRVYRTEVVPYDARHDAEARNREAGGYWKAFEPEVTIATEGPLHAVLEQEIEIPFAWTDGMVYLHVENPGSAYSLWLNDRQVAEVSDPLTPAEFDLTPFIREGANDFKLLMRNDNPARQLDAAAPVVRKSFENSYLYYQNKRSIADFEIGLVPDSLGRDFGMLDLKIVTQNAYNYEEPVTVGYDIYSPQGKLLEFNMTEITIPGRSTDTVRFSPFIYHTYKNKWEAGSKTPPLYKVMLFTRRNGVYKEYMPLKIGFGKTELVDGRIMRLGKGVKPRQGRIQRRRRPQDDARGAESPEGQGKEHHLPGLSAARMVLRVVRLSGPLRHRPGQHQRPGAERRPHRRGHAVERPSACRRLPRTREGDVLPFAQFHLRHRLLPGRSFGQRLQYVQGLPVAQIGRKVPSGDLLRHRRRVEFGPVNTTTQ